MKLSRKQERELKILRYWIPSNYSHKRITQKQVDDFFAWSDRGKPHGRNVLGVSRDNKADGFTALYWAKNRRDLQIASYKEDWGNTVSAWTFDEEPRYIVEDIAKRLKKPAILECWRTPDED